MSLSENSIVAITGAASGIGRALAVKLSQEKVAGLAIADIDEGRLAETATLSASVPVSIHKVDVADLNAVRQFADEVIEHHGRVTHLINNAGVGLLGSFEQLSIEDIEWLMGINFWGVVYGCKTFLPLLRQEPEAHIVNISSVFGFVAPEEQSAYCSSKFAVRGFTESLRHEMEGTNLFVSCVHPGGVLTDIARNSRLGSSTPVEWKSQAARFFDKVARTTPDKAAETIIRGIRARQPRILVGSDAYMISTISRLFPRRYLRLMERLAGHKMSLRKKA